MIKRTEFDEACLCCTPFEFCQAHPSTYSETACFLETDGELRDIVMESTLLRGRRRASWGTQFRILSGRAFKNLYRDPALLAAHYLSSIALACRYFSLFNPASHSMFILFKK